jgi:Mg2+ and Co2+ transporter CorA
MSTYQLMISELEGEKRALEDGVMMREREKEDMQRDLQGFQGEITAVKQQLITLQKAHENSERIRMETEVFVSEVVRVNDMLVQSLQ